MKHLLLKLFLIVSISVVYAEDSTVNIVQAKSQKALDVEVVMISNGVLEFKTAQGGPFKVNIGDLTEDSVARLREYWENRPETAELSKTEPEPQPVKEASADEVSKGLAVNEAIGHQLFSDSGSLWSENAEDVAKRLKLRQESIKANSSSYRRYTGSEYIFLGARPYCVTLYGIGGKANHPERFSLVFANKGDFGSTVGMGEDHFKKTHPDKELPTTLEEAIESDAEILAESLTKVLGEPVKQYYGERDDKRRVQRWDLGQHAFLLSSLKGEFTNLLIVETADADAQGKVQRINDSEFKKIQIRNVIKEDNGDVWIDNIPMVDQGPKGYCAPATFERAMRYMNVPADMYLLATSATAPGGGTLTRLLADDCKRIVRSKARSIKELDLHDDFSMKIIKRYIDKGVPVLWQMCSLEGYNDIANKRTAERGEVTDFAKWATEIQAEADQVVPSLSREDRHHICMIIGYNEQTGEVAVSDSWGPRYELRWVHADIAKAVTAQGGFVIDF